MAKTKHTQIRLKLILLGFATSTQPTKTNAISKGWCSRRTLFFTTNLAERKRTLLVDYIDDIRNAMKKVKSSHPFHIDAMVVLPDHLHATWTLTEGDAECPKRWPLIKADFSRCIPKDERRNPSRIAKGERGIWQRWYREDLIRDEKDHERHVDYIHFNPVNHSYVSRAIDWPYPSFLRYVLNTY